MSVFISLFTIALNAILAENFILVKFMGICPFMGVSKKQDTALGMGIAVTFVMGIASAATWAVNEFLLVPLNLVYMQTVVFILVIAALVQLVERLHLLVKPADHLRTIRAGVISKINRQNERLFIAAGTAVNFEYIAPYCHIAAFKNINIICSCYVGKSV